MCVSDSVLGSGEVLRLQLITIFAIIVTAGAWAYIYVSRGLGKKLWLFLAPILLWFVFGTLDIVITINGVFGNQLSEGDPAARFLFSQLGGLGAPVASVLWICLWAGIVYAINKARPGEMADLVSLAVFYSLVVGHLVGFSSWFVPLCMLSNPGLAEWPAPILLAALHYVAAGALGMRKT